MRARTAAAAPAFIPSLLLQFRLRVCVCVCARARTAAAATDDDHDDDDDDDDDNDAQQVPEERVVHTATISLAMSVC